MPLPVVDLVKIAWGGGIASGERWQTGCWFTWTPAALNITGAQLSTLAGHALTRMQTLFWGVDTTQNTSATTLDSCVATFYRGGVLQFSATANQTAVGGTGTAPQPVYTARVITLLTARAGRKYRGRMYIPTTSLAPTAATGLWATYITPLGHFKSVLTQTTSDILTDFGASTAGPVVVSQVSAEATPVTALRTDNKPDTQRGRERSINPTITDSVTIP